MFFTKPEYKEMMLPFTYDDNEEELYACVFSFEFYANVLDGYKYSSVSYCGKPDYADELAEWLRSHNGEALKVIFKIKKGKVKTVELDLDYLAQLYGDERIKKMDVAAWGYDVRSIKEVRNEMCRDKK